MASSRRAVTTLKYNLENLHWREFEVLAAYYLKVTIGQGLWSSDGSKDKGVDAEFHGTANEFPSKTKPFRGDWIFQVKHRTTRNQTVDSVQKNLVRTLPSELKKIFKKYKFACNHYVFVTNLNVTNDFRASAQKVFDTFIGGLAKPNPKPSTFSVVEYKDLEPFIQENQYVRRAFPALFSFSDVEEIFLEKEYTRNRGYINTVRRDIDKFVSTDHYRKAVDILSHSNILMLVGDPKSGKTSIVEALALSFISSGHCVPFFVRTPDEFVTTTAYLDKNQKALFICDDIFGQHELEGGKLEEWTNYFRSVMGLIDQNHRFVFTTRKYVFEQFANRSGLRAFFPTESDPSRYLITLSDLKADEREEILDKHLEHSTLDSTIISEAFRFKKQILACKDFSPEVIRSLVTLLSDKTISEVATTIENHVQNPNQYVYDLFDRITPDKQLLLVAVSVTPKNDAKTVESRFLSLLDDRRVTASGRFTIFIDELDGSIIRKRDFASSSELDYYHPSMYDVVVSICGSDRDYRHLMLRHLNLELLWLLTLRKDSSKPNPILIDADDLTELIIGINSLLTKDATLKDAATALQWMTGSFNAELPYALSLIQQFNNMKTLAASALSTSPFFESHLDETVDQWINLLDKMHSVTGANLAYGIELSTLHRSASKTDYWRLLFGIEANNQGFLKCHVDAKEFEALIRKLHERIRGLRLGLNFREGRPKTDENWLATFTLANDFISRMKKSREGLQIFNQVLLSDWEEVRKHSDFAKNRHTGMMKRGYWHKPIAINEISDWIG